MCKDIPNTTSAYAEEGTQAHAYAAWLLLGAKPPMPFEASREMVDFVSVYTNEIRRAADGKILLVEQKVGLEHFTLEPGGGGTADAIIVDIANATIEVHDLKYGQGHLVDAENNEQLMLYALGAAAMVEDLFGIDVKSAKLVIHQPRRDHLSEWTVERFDLNLFGLKVSDAGKRALTCIQGDYLEPSDSACLWCPVKATCPALREKVLTTVFDDFENLEVADIDPQAPPTPGVLALILEWVSNVREYIESKLNNGDKVSGWKLVAGKPGNRKWKDEAAVEQLVRASRIKLSDAFDQSLKNPTQLEKVVSDKKWEELFKPLITRSDAKPTMVAESDKRPAYVAATPGEFDEFLA